LADPGSSEGASGAKRDGKIAKRDSKLIGGVKLLAATIETAAPAAQRSPEYQDYLCQVVSAIRSVWRGLAVAQPLLPMDWIKALGDGLSSDNMVIAPIFMYGWLSGIAKFRTPQVGSVGVKALAISKLSRRFA